MTQIDECYQVLADPMAMPKSSRRRAGKNYRHLLYLRARGDDRRRRRPSHPPLRTGRRSIWPRPSAVLLLFAGPGALEDASRIAFLSSTRHLSHTCDSIQRLSTSGASISDRASTWTWFCRSSSTPKAPDSISLMSCAVPEDLVRSSGTITDDDLRAAIVLYNRIRAR